MLILTGAEVLLCGFLLCCGGLHAHKWQRSDASHVSLITSCQTAAPDRTCLGLVRLFQIRSEDARQNACVDHKHYSRSVLSSKKVLVLSMLEGIFAV